MNKIKMQNSLYSESGSSSEVDRRIDTESESEYEVEVKKSVYLREPPKVQKYDARSRKDVGEFFKEYENYCKEKFGENRKPWVTELGSFLIGKVAEYYGEMMKAKEPKYDIVKDRIIASVRRLKGSVRYRKKDMFEDARMEKGEKVGVYAQRLETLAREKFGDDDINERKELMKKFIATVPEKVAARINERRKEWMAYKGKRMLWEDVLEMVEDANFDDYEEVYRTSWDSNKDERSYSEVLKVMPVKQMEEFLDDYYAGERNGNGRREGRERSGSYDRKKVYVVGRNGNNWRKERNVRNEIAENVREVKCLRCGRNGHVRSECRWALGVCFGCGESGHMLRDCKNARGMKCFGCGQIGHRVSECSLGRDQNVNRLSARCGNCGKNGHYARMCKEPRRKCTQCGVEGHTAEVCRRRYMNQGVNAVNGSPGNEL